MKTRLIALALMVAAMADGSGAVARAADAPKPVKAKKFHARAAEALEAMKKRAAELKISGVAVVSYAPGGKIEGWMSSMAVAGRMQDDPTATEKGNNLIGIAYAKSAEMAATLEDSGTARRAPMTGEFGWQGGLILRVNTGWVIVAFSGGKSADDVAVSKAGLEVMKPGF